MTHLEALELLASAGFETGWALSDGVLIVWENEENPPAPLKRPKSTDETPSPA